MTKTYRISSRIRFTLFVAFVIVLITTFVNFALGLSVANSATITEYAQVEISSGDTLWSIAEEYMPANDDIRKSVHQLCKINDISAADLQTGMIIKVPIV